LILKIFQFNDRSFSYERISSNRPESTLVFTAFSSSSLSMIAALLDSAFNLSVFALLIAVRLLPPALMDLARFIAALAATTPSLTASTSVIVELIYELQAVLLPRLGREVDLLTTVRRGRSRTGCGCVGSRYATRSGYAQKCKAEEDRSVVILTTGSIKKWRREFYRSLTILIEGASIT
jgi:hypothetical protein